MLRAQIFAALALPLGCSSTAANQSPPDAAPDVAVAPDVTTTLDVTTVSDVTMVTDSVVMADTGVPLCPGASARECLTQAEVESRIRTPPQGGGGPIDGGARFLPRDVPSGIDVPLAPNGCYVPGAVRDGCCNAAVAVEREGARCCYTFCQGACCGRPFVVEGAARSAALVPHSPWVDAAPTLDTLDATTRTALARAWRDDALMEHASVASFARFTLQLLTLGAPPALVADAQRAALDEVDHAQRCFALAARYDGATLGPGRLDVGATLGGDTLDDVLRATIAEGCVGETCAALLAQRRAEGARDDTVRATLTKIASDEAAHAALAWRFVAWALEVGGARAQEVAREAIDRALATPPGVSDAAPGIDDTLRSAHGILSAQTSRMVIGEALREVIAPCARTLFAALDAQSSRSSRSSARFATAPSVATQGSQPPPQQRGQASSGSSR
jgi:hypothetical protein